MAEVTNDNCQIK